MSTLDTWSPRNLPTDGQALLQTVHEPRLDGVSLADYHVQDQLVLKLKEAKSIYQIDFYQTY